RSAVVAAEPTGSVTAASSTATATATPVSPAPRPWATAPQSRRESRPAAATLIEPSAETTPALREPVVSTATPPPPVPAPPPEPPSAREADTLRQILQELRHQRGG